MPNVSVENGILYFLQEEQWNCMFRSFTILMHAHMEVNKSIFNMIYYCLL